MAFSNDKLNIGEHFTALSGRNSVLQRPLYGAKRPQGNYCFSFALIMIV